MKRYVILIVALLFLISPAFAKDENSDMMRGAKLEELQPPAVALVVGANENIGSIAQAGWPVIVSATMLSEEGEPTAAPTNLKLNLLDEKDLPVPLVFEPVSRPAGDETQLFWIAPESATQKLAPERYHITFEEIAGVRIESGDLIIEEANPEHEELLGLLKIQRFLLLGKDDEALAEADRLTTSSPKNNNAWIAKGDILMSKDLPDEALEAYDKALELKKEDELLSLEQRRRAAFFRSLEKRGVLSNP